MQVVLICLLAYYFEVTASSLCLYNGLIRVYNMIHGDKTD